MNDVVMNSTKFNWRIFTGGSWAIFCIAWTTFLVIDWNIRKSGNITDGLPDFLLVVLMFLSVGGIIGSSVYASRDLRMGLLVVSVLLQGIIATALSFYLVFWYAFSVLGDSY